jgi:hypothetical protein
MTGSTDKRGQRFGCGVFRHLVLPAAEDGRMGHLRGQKASAASHESRIGRARLLPSPEMRTSRPETIRARQEPRPTGGGRGFTAPMVHRCARHLRSGTLSQIANLRSSIMNPLFHISRLATAWAAIWLAFGVTGCRHSRADFYPVGLYSVGQAEDLAAVRQVGFNAVTGPASAGFLDAAHKEGLKVLASPDTAAGTNFSPEAARNTVKRFDSHPALWSWYVVDEPDFQRISPEEVVGANRFIKRAGAKKPTSLVLWQGASALHYANITDITMIDRYPIPWLPLANFSQHVRETRLALGKDKPMIAVIQAFDWNAYPELVPGERNLRPPTHDELRCMTYCALAQRANGVFYYAFDSGAWRIREHPETWQALQEVVSEVNRYLPLFQAEHVWCPWVQDYRDWSRRFNAALEGSISPALLRVKKGNDDVPAGGYILTVNTTESSHHYRLRIMPLTSGVVRVLGEDRLVQLDNGWLEDDFAPYAVHVYGPLPTRE